MTIYWNGNVTKNVHSIAFIEEEEVKIFNRDGKLLITIQRDDLVSIVE